MQARRFRLLSNLVAILVVGAGAASAQQPKQKKGPSGPPMAMTIPAFKDGAESPEKFSCSNAPSGVSPEIQWENPPAATVSFAILYHEPGAHPQRGIYDITHWLIWNIPASTRELPEGVPATGELANGARQAKGPRGNFGYFGPCPGANGPKEGPLFHYTYELYALDTMLDLPADSSRADVMKAIDGHILTTAVYFNLFHR
jgi:Raf kinase inhibitor-like YbhB/YbcL family protein